MGREAFQWRALRRINEPSECHPPDSDLEPVTQGATRHINWKMPNTMALKTHSQQKTEPRLILPRLKVLTCRFPKMLIWWELNF